ncbi:DUF177 domain-containing protein [soil metagenome]
MNALVIDAFEYSRLNEHREGDLDIVDLTRLSEDLADNSGSLHWVLRGGTDKIEHPQLKLSVSGKVQLKCQRCLTAFPYDLVSESILILAKDEARADEIEALLDDDSVDVIVGTKALAVADLIEDEALLAIPFSPKHDVCPDGTTEEILNDVKKASPFAQLRNIKQ